MLVIALVLPICILSILAFSNNTKEQVNINLKTVGISDRFVIYSVSGLFIISIIQFIMVLHYKPFTLFLPTEVFYYISLPSIIFIANTIFIVISGYAIIKAKITKILIYIIVSLNFCMMYFTISIYLNDIVKYTIIK